MTQPAPGRSAYQLPIVLIGWGVLVTASVVIGVGWGLDVPTVRSVIPGAVALKVLVTVGLGSGAVAVLLLADHRRERRRNLRKGLAAVPGLLGIANRDPLTGLLNRRRFEEELDQLLARSRRTGESGSLLVFDLDRLKPINETFGRAIGDRMLRAVADVVTSRLRATDATGRLGAGEFAALLLGASPLDAVTIANALLAAIAEIEIQTDRGYGWTSASIGVTPIDAVLGTEASEYFGRAGAAVCRAKRGGGNQVVSGERPSVLSSSDVASVPNFSIP